MRILLILAVAITVSACAKRPDAITPASMPPGMYDNLSCAQASRERTQLATKLAALEKQQNGAATGDAIGVFLVLVPVSTLTSGDKEGEVATAKGQMIALDARLATCG